LIFLAFVIPLAVYSLILAHLNRHAHPVMVPGPWDFAGLLLAASGLLLFVGPAILTAIYEHWRLAWLLGRVHFLQHLGENWYFWVGLWTAYFVFIVAGAAWMLLRERTKTSIYNINPDAFTEALAQVCERLALESHCEGKQVVLRFRQNDKSNGLVSVAQHAPANNSGTTGPGGRAASWQAEKEAQQWAVLDLDPFPTMRHVTLRWQCSGGLIRQQVEEELATALTRIWTQDNRVSAWFMAIALCLLALAFFVLLAMAALQIIRLTR
jgi:hypothetical protein